MHDSEERLIQEAKSGCESALADLLHQYQGELRAYLARRIEFFGIRHRHFSALVSADEIIQEVFTDSLLGIGSFEGTDARAFRGWLYQIARNNLAAVIRGYETDKRTPPGPPVAPDLIPVDSHTKVVRAKDVHHRLHRAVNELPEPHATIVLRADLQSEPVRQIAEDLGCSIGVVHMKRARARKMLREFLGVESSFFTDCA